MPERFRKTWRREIVSSEGFTIRLSGRNSLTYRDSLGTVRIASEPTRGSGISLTVFSDSIPDTHERSRAQVMGNIARAFAFAGWVLIPS